MVAAVPERAVWARVKVQAGSFNLGGVEVAEPEPEAAPEGEGGEGGQFY